VNPPLGLALNVPWLGPLVTLNSRLDVAGLSTSCVSFTSTPGAGTVRTASAATL
jgi:hypothetical protein